MTLPTADLSDLTLFGTPLTLLVASDDAEASANDGGSSAEPGTNPGKGEAKTSSEGDNLSYSEEGSESDPGSSTGTKGSSFPMDVALMFGLIAVMMIVMIILPARARKKQQTKHADLVDGLKRDDKILLQSGKIVTVDKLEGDRIYVFADLAKNVKEEYHKSAILMKEADIRKGSNPREDQQR